MERELKQEFGHELEEVELIAGSGGVYEIAVDGTPVFSKKQLHRFPRPGEIVRLIRH